MNPAPPVRRIRLPLSIPKGNTSANPGNERLIALAMGLALAVLALAMYHPWEPRPFDILDFSEFLPLLRDGSGWLDRTSALTSYYVQEHGRLNVVSYLALALKWTVLGPDPVLWQWMRVAELLLLVAGVVVVLRRMAIGPVAAVAAASVFVVGRVSGEAWTRMTMGEPLGLLFALGALYLATRWRERRSIGNIIGTGVALMLAVLSKEMLIGVVPFVWLIGISRGADGRLGRPAFGAAERWWMLRISVLPVAAFVAALIVALDGGSGGFTTLYGATIDRTRATIELLLRPWFLQGQRPGLSALGLPGNTLFLGVLLVGGALAWRDTARRGPLITALIGAVGASVALAILYVPWPYFNLYYAIPFLLGIVLLYAVAFEALLASGRAGRLGAVLVWLGTLGGAAPAAAHAASYAIALQQVNGELAGFIARIPNADRIVTARRELAPAAWIGTASTLRRYALATGAASTLPPGQDLLCADIGPLLQRGIGRSVVISYLHNCGGFGTPSAQVIRRYRYVWVAWGGMGVAPDSVGADLLVGPDAMQRGRTPLGATAPD